jgi:alkylation response protein AidB-like acyl-CoA dehydrogenase
MYDEHQAELVFTDCRVGDDALLGKEGYGFYSAMRWINGGRVADRATQVFGGNGYMTAMGVERWARFVRAMRLYEGTSEILKTNIARTLGLDEPTRVPAVT